MCVMKEWYSCRNQWVCWFMLPLLITIYMHGVIFVANISHSTSPTNVGCALNGKPVCYMLYTLISWSSVLSRLIWCAGCWCYSFSWYGVYIQGHELLHPNFNSGRESTTVTEMIGTWGCLEVATGTYQLSVTDADAMDTIDSSEPAVTLDNILVPATNNNPSITPSLLPGRGNQPPNRDIIRFN